MTFGHLFSLLLLGLVFNPVRLYRIRVLPQVVDPIKREDSHRNCKETVGESSNRFEQGIKGLKKVGRSVEKTVHGSTFVRPKGNGKSQKSTTSIGMISLFRSGNVLPMLLIPIVGFLLWFPAFQGPNLIPVSNSMPLFDVLWWAVGSSALVRTGVAFALVLIEAYWFNYLVDHFGMLSRKSFVPGLMFVLLMSCSRSFQALSPIQPAMLCLMMALQRMMRSYRQSIAMALYFDASVWISIASLFFFPTLVFYPLVWVGLMVIRPFIWREWIVALVGLLLPYAFVFTWYDWWDRLGWFFQEKVFFPADFSLVPIASWPWHYQALLSCLGLLILFSFFRLLLGLPVNTIFSRNLTVVFVWMLALSILCFFLSPFASLHFLGFCSLPVGLYMANMFLEMRRWWVAELLFSGFLAVVCLHLYAPI